MRKVTQNIVSLAKACLGVVTLALALQSCEDPNSPGLEYMPDMYRSPALEAYSEYTFYWDSMATRKPVEGSVPRGFMPFPYPNTAEGYEAAGTELQNPLAYHADRVKEGKAIYEKFCIQCHGEKGDGQGPVATNPAWPGQPPAYNGRIKDLPEGKIFFSIHYGKGLMGSHAAQISQEDRWKLTYYVQTMQGKDLEAIHNGEAAESTSEVVEETESETTEEATASI